LAFNFDLRRYDEQGAAARDELAEDTQRALGRGLHFSTCLLNVSTFCWIRLVHDFPPVY
jgi:hypothetical protein